MAAEIQRAAELEIPAAVLEELLARDETPRRGFRGDPGQLSVFISNPNERTPMGHLDICLYFPITRPEFREFGLPENFWIWMYV